MRYDTTLKAILLAASERFFRQVAGAPVAQWLITETPQVQNLRLDLLGVTADDELVQIELQTTNDQSMALRMAEYYLRIVRQHKQFARQIVLYVGEAALTMPSEFVSKTMQFSYTLLDIRRLDTETLLDSPNIEDNLLAILTNLRDPTGTIREILKRIAALPEQERKDTFTQFLIISGLRRLEVAIEETAKTMSLAEIDAMLYEQVFGPKIRLGEEKGLQAGLQAGIQAGLQQGLQQGSYNTVKILLETRFGQLSPVVEEKLAALSASELEALIPRSLNAVSISELFPDTEPQADYR
jgi:hypothetical protein